MITHITVEDAAKLISRIAGTNEMQALTYIREAADRGEIQIADALEELQAELEQVKQKYDEAREAICTHCMDFPCSGESCYWWRGQKGG